jgi:5-methylcytosine-specific restriction endonuclease McrA
MPRAVKEWIGATDDTRPPPRVLLRIFEREGGKCHLSGRKIAPGEKWQADHKIAIINGGKNVESNLFPALVDKHKEKTRADVAEKARVAERAKSHIGAGGKPKGEIPSRPKPDKPAPRERAVGMPEIYRRFR